MSELAPNLGYKIDGVFVAGRDKPDFKAKQEEAWNHVRECIDNNIPCYGWELGVPEYYVVCGYDEEGYYYKFSGNDDLLGPKPWKDLGVSDIQVIEMNSVHPTEPAPPEKVVKDAFSFALKHAENPEEWIYSKYGSGLKGYETWADALENGTANRFGQGYNGQVWAECRENAVAFLKEAKEKLPGKADALFDEAIEHYTDVHSNLKQLGELHPFIKPGPDVDFKENLTSPEGAALLRNAAKSEERGLETLRKIIAVL